MSESSDQFSAVLGRLGGNAVVTLLGELDLGSAPELAGLLDSVVEDGPSEVVLDFSGLSFIDSTGISVLVKTQLALAKHGRHLAVRLPRPEAVRLFEVTGLLDFLHVDRETNEGPHRAS